MRKQSNFNQKFLNLLPCYNHTHTIHSYILTFVWHFICQSVKSYEKFRLSLEWSYCVARILAILKSDFPKIDFPSKQSGMINVIGRLVENVFENFSSPETKDSCGIKPQKFLIPKCDFPPPGAWAIANTVFIPKPSKFNQKSTGYKRRKKKMTCI